MPFVAIVDKLPKVGEVMRAPDMCWWIEDKHAMPDLHWVFSSVDKRIKHRRVKTRMPDPLYVVATKEVAGVQLNRKGVVLRVEAIEYAQSDWKGE